MSKLPDSKSAMGLTLIMILCFTRSVQSMTIHSVQIRDNVVPVMGSSIQLVCSVTGFISYTTVEWFITDTQDIPQTGPGSSAHAQCTRNSCVAIVKDYTYTADDSHMYVNITGLGQSNDGKWWTCKYGDSKQSLKLVVYTVPTSIQYDRVPDGPQDLSVNAVTLECRTNCVHPQPAITWFYVTESALQYQYTSSGVTSSRTNINCTSPEKYYTSTLTLARNTTFTDNSDTTVRFRCGIESFPGLLTKLYTPFSPNVTFAVPTTTPELANKTASGSLIVLSGDVTRLVCITSATRPAAKVTWKIGETTLQNVTNTFTITPNSLTTVTSIVTFTPDKTDNNKNITCMTRISGQTYSPTFKHSLNVWWGPSHATIEPSSPFPWRENQTDKYLLCKTSNGDKGNPAPTANWTSQYGTPDTTNRLVFKLLSSFHNKMAAICELSNEYTRLKGVHIKSQTTELDVHYNPIISITINNAPMHSVTVIEGQSLYISCLAEGNPIPTVQWLGRTTVNSQLQFVDINRDDADIYTCRASVIHKGHVFAREQNFSVVVNCLPAAPTSFTIEYIGQTYAVLSWKPGFCGRFNKTFIIQIRTGVKSWQDNLSKFGGEDVRDDRMFATVDNLLADKTYNIRMYSNNIEGNSVFTETLNFTTSEKSKDNSGAVTGGIIGGIIGGISILCITLVLTTFMLRRRQCTSEGKHMSRNCDNETDNDAHVYYSPTSADETVHYENVTADRTPEDQYETLNSDTPTEKIYLEINQEQDELPNTEERNTYVNLQLNVT